MKITNSILFREQNPRPLMPHIKVNPQASNALQPEVQDLPEEALFLQKFIATELAKGDQALIPVGEITAKRARWLVNNEIHEVIIRPSRKQPSHLLVTRHYEIGHIPIIRQDRFYVKKGTSPEFPLGFAIIGASSRKSCRDTVTFCTPGAFLKWLEALVSQELSGPTEPNEIFSLS